MANEINIALDAAKPELAASFKRIVINMFDRMVRDMGAHLKGIGNDWRYARAFRESVAPFVAKNEHGYRIDEDRLEAGANFYAEACVESWRGKIVVKMGELDAVYEAKLTGLEFFLKGRRGDYTVCIEQDCIINVSKNGKAFNQFPARIYIDGKFISEAKYKKLFA